MSNRWIDKSIYASPIWKLHHKSTYASLCARIGPTILWPEVSLVWPEIAVALKGLYIDTYPRIHTCTHIYGLVAHLDNIQSTFSSITISTRMLKRLQSTVDLLHDRSLSSVARDESHMAWDESRMARGEPRMTGDYCWPDESIHRCVCTHSHLYSYIYCLVALLDYIQSTFSIITIWTGHEPSAQYYFYLTILNKILKNPNPLTTIPAYQPQHHHHLSPSIITFLTTSTFNMSNETFKSGHGYVPKLTEENYPIRKEKICRVLNSKKDYNIVSSVEPLC